MYTTGFHSSTVDNKMGFGFEDLEGMSIKHQREIICHKAREMNEFSRLKYRFASNK